MASKFIVVTLRCEDQDRHTQRQQAGGTGQLRKRGRIPGLPSRPQVDHVGGDPPHDDDCHGNPETWAPDGRDDMVDEALQRRLALVTLRVNSGNRLHRILDMRRHRRGFSARSCRQVFRAEHRRSMTGREPAGKLTTCSITAASLKPDRGGRVGGVWNRIHHHPVSCST
jgi:hypothetical protein